MINGNILLEIKEKYDELFFVQTIKTCLKNESIVTNALDRALDSYDEFVNFSNGTDFIIYNKKNRNTRFCKVINLETPGIFDFFFHNYTKIEFLLSTISKFDPSKSEEFVQSIIKDDIKVEKKREYGKPIDGRFAHFVTNRSSDECDLKNLSEYDSTLNRDTRSMIYFFPIYSRTQDKIKFKKTPVIQDRLQNHVIIVFAIKEHYDDLKSIENLSQTIFTLLTNYFGDLYDIEDLFLKHSKMTFNTLQRFCFQTNQNTIDLKKIPIYSLHVYKTLEIISNYSHDLRTEIKKYYLDCLVDTRNTIEKLIKNKIIEYRLNKLGINH